MQIITDSCADLAPEQIKKFNIHVVPLGVFVDNKTFSDGIDITPQILFDKVKVSGKLPNTSAPSTAAFAEAFAIRGQHQHIVLVGQDMRGWFPRINTQAIPAFHFFFGNFGCVDVDGVPAA